MKNKKNVILIIEDEAYLRKLLKEKLTKEGFEVLEAGDGKVGLETALNKHPDVILLDIIMPVMDGISMLKKLRQDAWGKNIAVIVLSNLNEVEKINESVEENAYGFLVKSDWEIDDIVTLIRKKIVENKQQNQKI